MDLLCQMEAGWQDCSAGIHCSATTDTSLRYQFLIPTWVYLAGRPLDSENVETVTLIRAQEMLLLTLLHYYLT